MVSFQILDTNRNTYMPSDEERIHEIEHDIKETTRIIHKISENQQVAQVHQQITTDNINKLTTDMKKMLSVTLSCDIINERILNLENDLMDIKRTKNFLGLLVIGAVVTALLSLVIKGS